MASGVSELLDILFHMVDDAKNVPLSSEKCMLERDKVLDLIDEIRGQFPVELMEAKKLVASRSEYLAETKREADAMVKQAEERAKKLLSGDERLIKAKQRGIEILRQAEERSRELRKAANEYCEDALRRTEEAVAEAYEEIKRSRSRFRAASGTSGSSQSAASQQPFDAEAAERRN